MITIDIGGLAVGIDNRYKYVEELAKDYVTDAVPVFTVSVTDGDIEEEHRKSGVNATPGYFESIVAYRKIAEILPKHDAFVFHGSVISYEGRAYILTARSGVGKTTHTRLWLSEFGEKCHVLNGDKPVIRYKDGKFYACGTPWRGKEHYGVYETAELAGIAFLERGEENRAVGIEISDALTRLVIQVYKPKDRISAIRTMALMDRVLREVRLTRLECNMQSEAAHVARAAMVYGDYGENDGK